MLFCDTDPFATALWQERYAGTTTEEVWRIADRARHDLWIHTSVEGVPFEQDGWRDGEHVRHAMDRRFRDLLTARGMPHLVVSGSAGRTAGERGRGGGPAVQPTLSSENVVCLRRVKPRDSYSRIAFTLEAAACMNGVSPRARIPAATASTSRVASPCPRYDGSVQTALISVQPGGWSRSPAIAMSLPSLRNPR